ncbi:MAG TPA: TlpA family protein disulfide reductase [Umezawaea sp.]|nr:TlpA family protein disulfide reductase [Umezawaea sp.]
MPYLVVATVFVGLLCLLNLVLVAGVVRRLRDHAALLEERTSGLTSLRAGEEVGEFEVSTVEGELVGRRSLDADTLVAFFSPNCRPCHEKLPSFLDHARAFPGGRRRVLVGVSGDGEAAQSLAESLATVARVVLEHHDGALATAFRTTAYPTVLAVAPDRSGRVVVTSDRVDLVRPVALP